LADREPYRLDRQDQRRLGPPAHRRRRPAGPVIRPSRSRHIASGALASSSQAPAAEVSGSRSVAMPRSNVAAR